jgi:hypothetical protein
MSSKYVRGLRSVRSEFESTKSGLQYLEIHWNDEPVIAHIGPLKTVAINDVRNALQSCESVFIIRLFSAYEAMLIEHLSDHHPGINQPKRITSQWLIDRVAQLQSPHIGVGLCKSLHTIREYRNRIVHVTHAVPATLTLEKCLASMARYVDRLPEPVR